MADEEENDETEASSDAGATVVVDESTDEAPEVEVQAPTTVVIENGDGTNAETVQEAVQEAVGIEQRFAAFEASLADVIRTVGELSERVFDTQVQTEAVAEVVAEQAAEQDLVEDAVGETVDEVFDLEPDTEPDTAKVHPFWRSWKEWRGNK